MKNNCNVAKDLMPLCIDGVASEESQQYVDEHIAECTECAVAYGAMKVELPRANQEKERGEMEMAAKKVRRKRTLRALGTILIIAIVVGGIFAWKEIEERRAILEEERASLMEPVPLDMYDAAIYRTRYGRGVIVLKLKGDTEILASPAFHYEWAGTLGSEKTILEIEMNTRVYPDELDEDDVNSAKIWRVIFEGGVTGEEWTFSSLRSDETMPPYDEIALVCGDERKVIYTKGDEIPPCSEAMEDYYNAYLETKPVNVNYPEWRAELVKLLEAAPEVWSDAEMDSFMQQYVCSNGDLKLEALFAKVSRHPNDEGMRYVHLTSSPSGWPNFELQFESEILEDGKSFCLQLRPKYRGWHSTEHDAGFVISYGYSQDGVWVGYAGNEYGYLPIVRVELLSGDETTVLWELGDEVPTQWEVNEEEDKLLESLREKNE